MNTLNNSMTTDLTTNTKQIPERHDLQKFTEEVDSLIGLYLNKLNN